VGPPRDLGGESRWPERVLTGRVVSLGLPCCGVTKLRIVLRSVTGREMVRKAA